MKITVSVKGRFWAFNLAGELSKQGHLHRLITTYPKFIAKQYGIPAAQVCSLLPIEILSRGWDKGPRRLKALYDPDADLCELFDFWASKKIPNDTDIFVALSAVALHGIRSAHKYGALAVVDEGSSHAQYQRRIVTEEYERYRLKPSLNPERVMRKELQEYEETDYIAVPSQFVVNTFLEHGVSEKKLLLIPYGVDTQEFKPVPKQDPIFRIIYCGALTLRKGVHYLLQAFSELNLANAELWLIGQTADEIKPFLGQYDNGRVFHKGPYAQRELYRYYSQGSVFCLPSIEDGFGMVISQAMACGLPVIATTHTGGPDVVEEGKHGFIVAPRDVEALKERIFYFYKHPEACEAMGQAAMAHIKASYTWEHYGARAAAAYRKILGR